MFSGVNNTSYNAPFDNDVDSSHQTTGITADEVCSDSTPATTEETTEIRSGTEYVNMSFPRLLNMVKVNRVDFFNTKATELKTSIQDISKRYKSMQNGLAELTSISKDTQTVKIAELQKVANIFQEIKDAGVDHDLLNQVTLSADQLQSLISFLQHKTAGDEMELSQQQSHLQEVTESYKTIMETLIQILSTIKDIIHKILTK